MTFAANETGVETGRPIELYTFRIGSDPTPDRFTSSENDVTIPSTLEKFTAIPIRRASLVEELNNPNTNRLEVRMPADEAFVQQFRTIAPGEKATLTIQRMHRDDLGGSDERIVIFKGTVRNVSYADDGRLAILQALPLTSAYSRLLPRRTYQTPCNHDLYGPLCTIDKDDPNFRHDGTVTAVSGDTITVSGAAAKNALTDFFETGFVVFNNEARAVVAQSGDDLTLRLPFITSPLNQTVIARAGCKHRVSTDCDTKFGNVDNNGGFAYVAPKNPFEGLT